MYRLAIKPTTKHALYGFTLIEVMLVVLVVGLMASIVQFSFGGQTAQDKLRTQAEKFQAIFSLASEYALLNNAQLGLVVNEQSYQFLGFDGEQWQVITQAGISKVEVPEPITLQLQLDDLPIEQPSMLQIDEVKQVQKQQQERFLEQNKTKKPLFPQVLIFSSGDITPFSLIFSGEQDGIELSFKVTGLYSPELTFSGPYLNGRLINE